MRTFNIFLHVSHIMDMLTKGGVLCRVIYGLELFFEICVILNKNDLDQKQNFHSNIFATPVC